MSLPVFMRLPETAAAKKETKYLAYTSRFVLDNELLWHEWYRIKKYLSKILKHWFHTFLIFHSLASCNLSSTHKSNPNLRAKKLARKIDAHKNNALNAIESNRTGGMKRYKLGKVRKIAYFPQFFLYITLSSQRCTLPSHRSLIDGHIL